MLSIRKIDPTKDGFAVANDRICDFFGRIFFQEKIQGRDAKNIRHTAKSAVISND
jgi:hypothetical protein